MTTLTANFPLLPEHCAHKLPTSCGLTAMPTCCACQDKRAHSSSYFKYIDGIGFVLGGTRQGRYCWMCKEFWNARIGASRMRQSETRIPELPNQDDFLERWYDWHRGYRIIKHDDGSEEHQPMLGERLMDTAIGHLPRTLGEVQSGILENVNDQVNVFVDSIPSEPDDLEIDPEDRLFDPLSSDLDAPNMTSPSENSILQDLTSFLTELETHLHNLEDSLRTNRLEDFLIPAESEYGFNVQNHQATTYEAISDASHTYQATLTLLASTMRELQAREFLLRRNRNTETFAGEELRQRAEELWQLAEESRGRAEALEQAQESQQQDEESRQRDEELLRALSTPNTLYMHIVTYRRILHFTRGRLNRLEAMSSQSGTAPEPTADVLATWTFRDRDTLLSDNVPFPQTTSLRAEEVEINHSSFSRNPRTVQREALDDTDSSDEFDDEFDRIHSEDDEEQDTLVVKNRGLDKDGWPEALKEEDLVVKLDCKICYAQLASITVIPCGHLAMCKWCADEYVPSDPQDKTHPANMAECPICRRIIKMKVTTFTC